MGLPRAKADQDAITILATYNDVSLFSLDRLRLRYRKVGPISFERKAVCCETPVTIVSDRKSKI